ncbi:hypothetical protein DM02DRAFT_611452 [Periconia macrospinosa]|uniref:Transcription factor Iwr1 domain-containing protein n=1 Tax=Periconia macrospinosa TaxID=97972 RepID=A0A2V1E4Y6_9PLEO|nr:hypothetical protein DM02DRAFT_611452 [Periconia macrospinosa]
MSRDPPQTLSVKRKRLDPAVETLVVEPGEKRQKSDAFAWRLVTKPGAQPVPQPLLSPALPDRPQFHVSYSAADRKSRVLIQAKASNTQATPVAEQNQLTQDSRASAVIQPTQNGTTRVQKRPGAGTSLHGLRPVASKRMLNAESPSEDEIKQFEKFSEEVEQDEVAKSKPPSTPLKFAPKVPALRFRERHPEKAAQLDADAMDIDDYVYDTYVREVVMPDAEGKYPEPQGTVGVIVLKDEDEDWWNGDEESDREFDTDDEDENAEDYYANDYPEDELSSDDEYGRNPYQSKFRHGSDDEELSWNDDDDDAGAFSDGDEDDEHFRRIAPPRPAPGYWGQMGE